MPVLIQGRDAVVISDAEIAPRAGYDGVSRLEKVMAAQQAAVISTVGVGTRKPLSATWVCAHKAPRMEREALEGGAVVDDVVVASRAPAYPGVHNETARLWTRFTPLKYKAPTYRGQNSLAKHARSKRCPSR